MITYCTVVLYVSVRLLNATMQILWFLAFNKQITEDFRKKIMIIVGVMLLPLYRMIL